MGSTGLLAKAARGNSVSEVVARARLIGLVVADCARPRGREAGVFES